MLRIQALGVVLIVLAAGTAVAQQNVTGISPGETVTVVPPQTRLMRGDRTLGVLARGQTFDVLRVMDGWLGTRVEIDGELTGGWVWHRHVRPEVGQPDPPGAATGVYRRYSYEPEVFRSLPGPQVVPRDAARRRSTPPETRLRPGSRRW